MAARRAAAIRRDGHHRGRRLARQAAVEHRGVVLQPIPGCRGGRAVGRPSLVSAPVAVTSIVAELVWINVRMVDLKLTIAVLYGHCLLYTSPSPRDGLL